jgi:CRISPR-associated protein Csa3
MKTYITLSGFDSSQIVSLIVKYGIEGGDRIILIRPEEEKDSRGETTVQAIKDLSRQIDSNIRVDIHRVNHHDFEEMVISMIDLIKNAEGHVVVNISGGPREIFLAFIVACMSQSRKIHRVANYSDIDRVMTEITLPNITNTLDAKLKKILEDVLENQPTQIKEIAKRLDVSESTISRQINKLDELDSVYLVQKGKTKYVSITLTGRILLN